MNRFVSISLCFLFFAITIHAQHEIIKTESRIPGLNIAITHRMPAAPSNDYAVLFLHGSSFPSQLSFGFRMNGYSWMDNLAENGYDVYALDFLGYGNSDRYAGMVTNSPHGKPLGKAIEIYQDVDKAVELIKKKTGKQKVHLIAHSWGGSVAALYAEKFPDKIAMLVLFAAIIARNETIEIGKIETPYESLTPGQRIHSMKSLTPAGEECQLEQEMFASWGEAWLRSDSLSFQNNAGTVKFPAGPSVDVQNLLHNKTYFNVENIKVPVLIIRGEWDEYPNNADAENLLTSLKNSPYKKY